MTKGRVVLGLVLMALLTSAQCQQTEEDWINKCNVFYNAGDYDSAAKCFDEAKLAKYNATVSAPDKDPENADAWISKGDAIEDKAMGVTGIVQDVWTPEENISFDEAAACYDKAIEIDPENADAWFSKGNLLSIRHKDEEAIKAFNKSIELNPQEAYIWEFKFEALRELGKTDEAIQSIDKAIYLAPEHSEIVNNVSIAGKSHYLMKKKNFLKSIGRITEANAVLAKARELDAGA